MTREFARRAFPRQSALRPVPLMRTLGALVFGVAVGAALPAGAQSDTASNEAAAGAAGQPADATSPVGLWRSIDDETKKPKALIRITQDGGAYVGRIEKILTARTDAVCDQCTDERKDQPVQGMRIVDGMRASDEEAGLYEGGRILDPQNGKVYRSRMRVVDEGARLEVRGYIGAPLFGRTQTWIREH